jgi:putative transposon-encoded protein
MNKESKQSSAGKMNDDRDAFAESAKKILEDAKSKVKFEVFGEEMIEKTVKLSGNSGRVYLPPTWVGHNVKIIRIN